MIRILAIASIAILSFAAPSYAQTAGPYVSGHGGLLGGDGGAAASMGGSIGYMTAQRLGFELELSVSPGLDFGDLGFSRDLPPNPLGIPRPTLDATGRLLTFHTNVLKEIGSGDSVRVFGVAGGGMTNVHRDVVITYPDFVFPSDFVFSPNLELPPGFVFPLPRPSFELVERRVSSSENALSLSAGGIVEIEVRPRFTIGVDARYMHVFVDPDGMHNARVTARARWAF